MKIISVFCFVISLVIQPAYGATTDEAGVDCKQGCDDKVEVNNAVVDQWGIDDFKVRISGHGYLLDIRYRVVDSVKAKKMFDQMIQPYIIQESTGYKYTVPSNAKVGFLRQKPRYVEDDRVYFMMMANPARKIQPGEKVTLVVGDFNVEGLTVE